MSVSWAVHRLNGISSPANATYSVDELIHQLKTSQCRALFTVQSLLPVALKAAKVAGIAQDRIYLCEMSDDSDSEKFAGFRTVGQLIQEGESLPELERVAWQHGQGAKQTAFLCYSSGTSGLPVSEKLSIKVNCELLVIANTESGHDLPQKRHRQYHSAVPI